MGFLVYALIVGLVTVAVVWTIAEVLATRGDSKPGERAASSGTDTAIGNPAVVTRSFSKDDTGTLRGRVSFEGEDWQAVFAGDPEKPPTKGDTVTILEVDAGHLEVRVE